VINSGGMSVGGGFFEGNYLCIYVIFKQKDSICFVFPIPLILFITLYSADTIS